MELYLAPWMFWAALGGGLLIVQIVLYNMGVRVLLYVGIGCVLAALGTLSSLQTTWSNIGVYIAVIGTVVSWLVLRKRLEPK